MAVSKHNLTKGKDNIAGSGAVDLFLGPLKNGKATLSDADALDGKGGFDTLRAVLAGYELTPDAKNIEKGIFARKPGEDCQLDLVKAKAMSQLVFHDFDTLA